MLDTERIELPIKDNLHGNRGEILAYDVFASPVPVPEERRDTMIGIRFDNKTEALERVGTLRRAGWHVYRVAGPGGFEMTENLINQFINSLPQPSVSKDRPD